MKQTKLFSKRRYSFLTILILLSSTVLNAQNKGLVIKERLEITPGQGIINSSVNKSTQILERPDFFILPRSGTIELSYWFMSIENPIPANSYIVVTIGNKIYKYNMFPYLKVEEYLYHQYEECFGWDLFHHIYFYDPDDSSQKIFFMGHANDTVRVSYCTSESHNLNTYDYGYIFNYHSPATEVPCLCDCPYPLTHPFSPEHIEGTFVYRDEIMLGESKYLQAYWDGNEIGWASPWTDTPDHVGAETPGVTFTVEPLNGSKCGVYWEQLTEPGKRDMIRLIGRYWEKDSTFAVKVTAKYNGDEVDYWSPIYTMAPDRLGDDYGPLSNGGRRTSVSDVYSHQYNLDSVIIKYAGKYGIPPQILKADMQQEGNFQPAYRWEPFVDANIQFRNLQYMDDDFRYRKTINPNSEGQPGIPTNHTNVFPIQYPQNDYSTIWDRFFAQSRTLDPSSGVNRYPIGTWWTPPSTEWGRRYNSKFVSLRKQEVSLNAAKSQATEYANEYLRDEYQDGIMSEGIAQTRTAASYGLMQMQYATAVEYRDYPLDRTSSGQSHLPEYINITDTNLTYTIPFLLSKINVELIEEGDGNGKAFNWTLGFERTIIVALNMYNGKTARVPSTRCPDTRYNWHYGFDVLDKVNQYLPQNK